MHFKMKQCCQLLVQNTKVILYWSGIVWIGSLIVFKFLYFFPFVFDKFDAYWKRLY